jgi:hypothetical protein
MLFFIGGIVLMLMLKNFSINMRIKLIANGASKWTGSSEGGGIVPCRR